MCALKIVDFVPGLHKREMVKTIFPELLCVRRENRNLATRIAYMEGG